MTSAGGILSNTEDLLKFIEANLGKADALISTALEKTQEYLVKKPDGGGIGLAWLIYEWRGQTFYHHAGATTGYISFAAFEKSQQTGAVLLSNYADHHAKDNSLVQMGMHLAYCASKGTL
jgi:CubicO group peptidase (beta-lactamase class C family)